MLVNTGRTDEINKMTGESPADDLLTAFAHDVISARDRHVQDVALLASELLALSLVFANFPS